MLGLLDNLLSLPSTNGAERAERSPRLRRKKSWIGRPQSQGTSQHSHARSKAETTADELNPNGHGHSDSKDDTLSKASTAVMSEEMVPEYHDRRTGYFVLDDNRKAVKDVTFEPISNHPKLSKRRSRGFGDFISLLRNQKLQRLGSSEGEATSRYHLGTDGDIRDGSNGGTANSRAGGPQGADCGGGFVDRANDSSKENGEYRNVSEQTAVSQNSDRTASTVCRDPSKRTTTPIAILGRDYTYENPFDGTRESSHPGPGCDPFADQAAVASQSTRQSSSLYSDHVSVQSYRGLLVNRPNNPISKSSSFNSTSQSTGSSFRTESMGIDNSVYALSKDRRWSTKFNYRKAAEAFNELADKLNVQPLALDGCQPLSGDESYEPAVENSKSRRRDRVLGRMRVMRSSLTIRALAVGQERGLRRMKTFASLSSCSPQMVSLRGKSLAILARLGGYSFLELPGDFAPGPLKLPACFVSMARYLRSYAPSVRNVFFDPGDAKKAGRLYDYFADQVLAAEKESELIEMTMRSSKMPSELETLHLGRPAKNSTQVHNAASVFKALLAGLPGGILGSPELYRVLVEVYYARSSECDLQWTESCAGGAQVMDFVKIQAIAHAIMALTSDMQLELMCAVFGECALLLYETERMTMVEQQGQQNRAPTSYLSGLMTLDRLARVFGPLLLGETATQHDGDSFRQVEMEIERERVASMVIGQWRQVSRQLRRGQLQRRRGAYRLESWGEEQTSTASSG